MTVRAHEKDRIVWSDAIEIFASRKHRRLPECFNPAATCNPLAGLGLVHACFNFREKALKVGDSFEIQSHLALTNARQMTVRISETGQYSLTMQINYTRRLANELLCISVRADEYDSVSPDGYSLSMSLLIVGGVDVAVLQNEIGGVSRDKSWRSEIQDAEHDNAQQSKQGFHDRSFAAEAESNGKRGHLYHRRSNQ